MIPYLGDYSEDSSVYIPFNTFDSNDPSASVTATTLVDADIKVHKDGSVTEIVTDGATIAIDFDTVTGNHLITVDTSVHADYATGSDYLVRIEGATVDGGNINAWVGQFSIENRHSAGALRPTVAGRTLDVSAGGEAGIDWANVGSPTTAVDLSATDIQLCDTITTYTGNTVQTGDSFARIGVAGAGLTNINLPNQTMDITGNLSGSVGSVTGAVGSVTGAVGSVTGSVGSVTGAVGSVTAAVTIDAGSVDAVWDETLTAHATADSAAVHLKDILADTNELQSDDVPGLIAALNDVSTAQVNAEVDTALSDIGLDHLLSAAVVGTDVTDNSVIAKLASKSATADWDSYVNTTDALEAIADSGGGGPTADQIADAVWDEAQADHVGAGTFGIIASEVADILVDTGEIGAAGAGLTEAGGTGDQLTAVPWNSAWDAQVESEVDDALVARDLHFLVNTALPTNWATDVAANSALDYLADDGTAVYDRTTDSLQAIADSGGGGPTAEQIADQVWDEALSGHVGAGSFGKAVADIETDATAILADTNELQGDWANGGRLDVILDARASQSSVDTIDGIVDNILIDTAEIGAAGAGLTALATQASVNTIDGIVDAILVDTGTTLPASIATVDGNVDAILVDTGTTLPASLATIDGNVDAILVDTAEIGAAGAGLTVLATAANLATVDTVVDAIKAQTDSLNFTVAGVVDANTLRINGAVVVGDGNATPWDGA